MSEYVLHCFGESGNAYKAALMLQLCGLDWEPRFVDFFAGATRDPAYRAEVNEMGEVPVLDHAGLRLTQSGVILDYLAGITGRFGRGNAGRTPRDPALDPVRQPQVHELPGDAAVPAGLPQDRGYAGDRILPRTRRGRLRAG